MVNSPAVARMGGSRLGVDFKIAIVGSGPAGLSAAARAARRGVSHVLLERSAHLNDTIFKYQKRKHVMATPEILPLRSDLDFKEESREEVIDAWTAGIAAAGANIRLNAEVAKIEGAEGNFTLTLGSGETLTAAYVVLAIGVQGNLNRLRIPGAELPFVQYQLDDPDEYTAEEIVVVGVGDAGLENALALAVNNSVSIVNTGTDFPRAKAGNRALIEAAIKRGDIQHYVNAKPSAIEPGVLLLETADGVARVPCDRIIARIGAQPPRRFVESCGVVFPSADPNAFPVVSETYESQQVKGLYIIGALAGYPLIKHCLNQGYEVVEYIEGNPIAPADEPLLQAKLREARLDMSVGELIAAIRERLPLFSSLTPLQIREFLIHSTLHNCAAGDIVFRRNDFANSLYSILDGEVGIQVGPGGEMVRLSRGEFFGEMALISGLRRTATVAATKNAVLLEVDRNTMIRLVRSDPQVKQGIDGQAVIRQIKTYLAPQVEDRLLADLVASSSVVEFKRDEVLIQEGDDKDDSVYLIRKGSVTVSVRQNGRDVVLAYVPAGNYVGEMALMMQRPRTATVKAAIATEAIRMDSAHFRALLDRDPELRRKVEQKLELHLAQDRSTHPGDDSGEVIEFMMHQGLAEATDVLLIDESLCVRCDNCEKACAETHHGVSRLNREAGPTFGMLHVPTSCRHCEDPHCMQDCPPDAIHRQPTGEVYIDDGQCIGCGNCERNCPYGVIQMAAVPARKPGLLSWLLFGSGPGPGEDRSAAGIAARTGGKHAVKCDMCKGIAGGPACVRACPTGAAIRVEPGQFIDVMRQVRG